MHQVYVIDVFWGLYSESCLEEGQQEPDLHILLQPQDLLTTSSSLQKYLVGISTRLSLSYASFLKLKFSSC